MGNEREILFIKVGKGQTDKGKVYYFIDYVDCNKLYSKRDFITAIDYDRINKKMGDKHLVKVTGILDINIYDKVYIADIK